MDEFKRDKVFRLARVSIFLEASLSIQVVLDDDDSFAFLNVVSKL